MVARLKPFTVAAFGAKGTGKTAWSKQMLRASGARRVMVWDFKADADLDDLGQSFTSWREFVAACKRPAFSARYIVSPEHDPNQQFAAFCDLAWREGNVVMFVDELAEVTRASKAPAEWRRCVNVGRNYANGTKAIAIIGASQRPSEVDKSFIANADVVHCGRLGYINDAKQFAAQWGVDASELANLPNLHWIEKRAACPGVFRGVLTFAGNAKRKTTRGQTGQGGHP